MINPILKTFLTRFAILIAGLCGVVCLVYAGLWFFLVNQYHNTVQALWDHVQNSKTYTLTQPMPRIDGFPDLPHLHYAGTLSTSEGLRLDVPDFSMKGFPAPGQLQHMTLAKGFTLSAPFMERVVNVQSAEIFLRYPASPPVSDSVAAITAWQKRQDPVRIEYSKFETLGMIVECQGELGLDDDLQLKGFLHLRVDGIMAFLDKIEGDSEDKKNNLKMARSIVAMMSETDAITGKTYFKTVARFENKGVFLGPLKIFPLPHLSWGRPADAPRRIKPE